MTIDRHSAVRPGRPLKPMRDRIAAKVNRPEGMSRHDIRSGFDGKGNDRDNALATLDAMLGEGVVFLFSRAPLGGQGRRSERYFLSHELGKAWASKPDGRAAPVRKLAKPKQRLTSIVEQTDGRAWRNLTQRPADGAAVISAGTKHTVLHTPQFDARYQCDPKERVIGGFASLGPGRYLDGMA